MNKPKLETLARELETIRDGQKKDIGWLIENARNDNYPRHALIADLVLVELKFFAKKVESGYYDKE